MFDTGEVPNTNLSKLHAGLPDAVAPATALLDRDDLLPAPEALWPLLGASGLRRGSLLAVEGAGAVTLTFALLAATTARHGWCAAVGAGSLGLLAAHHLHLDLSRLVLVDDPGEDWPTIVAALLDAFEIVVLGPLGPTSPRLQRRLAGRVRDRDRVLVSLGSSPALPLVPADIRLAGTASVWEGLGWGYGHLRSRQVHVRAEGRRLAGRTRRATLWLPAADGRLAADTRGTGRPYRPVLVEASA